MTIAAAYLTSEGVVLGADSTTSVILSASGGGQPGQVAQLLNHAQKVFEIGERSRLCLCTWGSGVVGDLSQRTLVARLADQVDQQKTTVEQAAELLVGIVNTACSALGGTPAVKPSGGYFLGGWDPGTHVPACVELVYTEEGTLAIRRSLKCGQAVFAGSHEYFGRVIRGFDRRLPGLLRDELEKEMGAVPDGFAGIYERAFTRVAALLATPGFQDLPIREAIDFVHTYLYLTAKACKFRFGPPTAGGPIEIGFVSTDRCFRWVRHKTHLSAVIEGETRS